MLSYRNERVLTQAASIHPYFPYVRVQVAADVVLFRPRPGMRLGAQRRAPAAGSGDNACQVAAKGLLWADCCAALS